jgi:sec-independent protein translocase protein TatB
MDFLGIGPVELMVILALALIVVGPRKLPDLGRQVGRAIYQFRKATQEITDEFSKEFVDVHATVNDVRATGTEFNPITTIKKSMDEAVAAFNEPLRSQPASVAPPPVTVLPPSDSVTAGMTETVAVLDPLALTPPPPRDAAEVSGRTARQGGGQSLADTRQLVPPDPASFGDDGTEPPLGGTVVPFDPARSRKGDVA